MSRKEEAMRMAVAEEARQRLRQGVRRTKVLVTDYRLRLLMLREPAPRKAIG